MILGTRVSVEIILKRLSEGATVQDLIEAWPNLTEDDVRAALAYSADVLAREELLILWACYIVHQHSPDAGRCGWPKSRRNSPRP